MDKDELARRNIKRFRQEAGISQARLADLIGTTSDTVHKWEQGTRKKPGTDYILELARVFKRPVEDFFKENPPKQKPLDQPAVRLKVLDKHLSPELRREAEEWERSFNRRALDEVVEEKRKGSPRR